MKFAIIGLGYIAPRHVKAIYDLGHEVEYACDPCTNVGWLDSFDRNIKFTTDIEEFFEWTEEVDYTVICTPNNDHAWMALEANSDKVIVEKPVCIDPNHLSGLKAKGNIHFISQLRLHPAVQSFQRNLDMNIVMIDYVTPRGDWYFNSWKNDPKMSGGLITNIGIHLFDLLLYLFGDHNNTEIYKDQNEKYIEGISAFDRCSAMWRLSIENHHELIRRDFIINGERLDLSDNDLHLKNYEEILKGNFKIEEAEETIKLMDELRKELKNEIPI